MYIGYVYISAYDKKFDDRFDKYFHIKCDNKFDFLHV